MSSGDGWTIRALLRPHLRTIVFITVLQIIGVVAQAIAIIMLKPILNNGIYEGDFSKLALFGCYLIISTLILSLVLFVTTNLASKVATSVAEELRGRLVEAAVKSNNINALGIVPSEAMVCLTNDVSSVQRFVFETLRTYLPMPILLGILIVYTFNTNAILGTILFLTMAFVGSFTYIFTKRLQPLYKKQVETMSNVNASLREKIPGARTIRAYDGYDYEEKKFGDYSAQFGSMNRKVVLNSYYVSSLVTACMWIFIVFTFVASALDEGNKLIATDIIIFMQVATYIIATLALIPYAYVGVPRMRECFSHLKSVVTNAQSMERTYGESEADEDGGKIFSATDVHLRSRHGRTIFDGIDLEIDKGKTVSIVGPNGNNSSELFKMALGFTIPDSGKLKVFGLDVSSTDPDLLRGRISYVNNSMHIFRGTLRYNLDQKGNHSDEEILSVCDRIGLGRFI
ncbi:MAG: ABC transporter ATP-binding protein, partial [Candidatus Methanomethylophilaceae archaeon]|nr:ABC transporter ATP-binding protein [Candidatus Methanomethylophilaceae archaeon]